MRPFPLLAFFFLFLTQSATAQTYYIVKFPDDMTVYGCGAAADTVYPVITQNFNCNFNIGVSVHDQVYTSSGGDACSKIIRRFRLLYWCDYDPSYIPYYIPNPPGSDTGPTVTADPTNHGYLEYYQIIKILDPEAPVFTDCPASPVIFCDYSTNDPGQFNNGHTDLCEGEVDLSVSVTDACSGSNLLLSYLMYLDLNGDGSMETFVGSSMSNAWPITTSVNGSELTGQVQFQPGEGLPYGTHKIKWIANDKCGNETVCEYLFTVKDCNPPTVVCHHGLSVNIMPGGMITLNDQDFLHYTYDNCTPSAQIELGIVKAAQSTGAFPTGSHTVTFDCSELGQQEVQLWVQDEFGNASHCQTYVIVDDHLGHCAPSTLINAAVSTMQNQPVPGVTVQLKHGAQAMASSTTDDQGQFQFASIPAGCDYLFTPSLPVDDAGGLNTMDALLIAAHLYEDMSLGSPYKLLAADTDQSGDLSDADIDALIQVVLGQVPSLPGTPAWKFLPAGYVFADPQQPWNDVLPQGIEACLSSLIAVQPDFTGIKMGDVNASAQPSFTSSPEDRDPAPRIHFYTPNVHFSAGETFSVSLRTPDLDGLAGFQFTLDYDPAFLQAQAVNADLVPEKWLAHFPEEHLLTASWHNSALLAAGGKNAFHNALTIEFTALQDGWLSDVLHMTDARTPSEVYTSRLQTLGAALDFDRRASAQPALLPVTPNPVSGIFAARFFLPEAGEYRLQLVDALGMPVYEMNGSAAAGYQEVAIDPGYQRGLLFLSLQTGGGVVQRSVRVE